MENDGQSIDKKKARKKRNRILAMKELLDEMKKRMKEKEEAARVKFHINKQHLQRRGISNRKRYQNQYADFEVLLTEMERNITELEELTKND